MYRLRKLARLLAGILQLMIARIFLPFLLVIMISSSTTLWWSAKSVNSLIEREYWGRTQHVMKLLSSRPYLLTRQILTQLEEVTRSHIALYDIHGYPFDYEDHKKKGGNPIYELFPDLPEEITQRVELEERHMIPIDINDGKVFFHVVTLPSHDNVIVAVMVSSMPLVNLRSEIIWSLGFNGLVGMSLLLGMALLLSHILTRNFKNLASSMERVAEGDLECRFTVAGMPELQRLAATFNNMIERILDYQKKLAETERLAAAGQLSLSLAHEVRNPLTAIKMMVQVMRKRLAGDNETVRLIDIILREIHRIDLLIRDIMVWNRPAPPKKEFADLDSLVTEILELIRPSMEKDKIILQYKKGDPPRVRVDPAQIKQVLWNLLQNARKASQPGDTIIVRTEISGDGSVCFVVEDQGKGIKPDDATRIFEPFFSTTVSGLGLGLSISRRIAKEHGGDIIVENRDSGGVKATVMLPSDSYEAAIPGEQDTHNR